MPQKMEYTVLDLIESAVRQARVSPMILGGLGGPDGGEGGPPGGFVGQLPQKRVTYDTTEAATLFTPASGVSLLDNLNHIRYWLFSGHALAVEDYDGSPYVFPVKRITFSGAAITDLGGGRVLVAMSGGGGGGSALTVQEADGSPIINNVDKIIFSGATVTDLGSGDVKVSIIPGVTLPNVVLLTDSQGNIYCPPWLKWGTSSQEYVEFGADVAGKETNAGRMGYETFGAGYFYIVGAGTTGGDRRLRVYDKIYADLFTGSVTLNSMPSAQVLATDSGSTIIDGTNQYKEGWIPVTETWTRTGDHTFTLAGDYASNYRKGTKVRYNDGGSDEYGVVYSAVHSAGTTTVTLITNDDYAMAAATITGKYISHTENPYGFPDWFNYTPTYDASGSMTFTSVTTDFAKWKADDHTIFWNLRASGTTGGTASTQITATLPCTALSYGSGKNPAFVATVADTTADIGRGVFNLASSTAAFFKSGSGNWGLGASRFIIGQGFYEY